MHDSSSSSPYEGDTRQRWAAAELGIWLFLSSEILFFGGLFTSYTVYRTLYVQAFEIAARETELTIGAINTAVLLTSSLFIALAVKTARTERALSQTLIALTVVCGLGFLALKAIEYWIDIEKGLVPGRSFSLSPPETEIFWALYWLMTGVHAVHVLAGMGILSTLYLLRRAGRIGERSPALEVGALYWHLVDVIWIFLFPIIYLVGRS